MAHRYSKRLDSSGSTKQTPNGDQQRDEENPNVVVYRKNEFGIDMSSQQDNSVASNPNSVKMESMIERMQEEHTGVPVRTVKSFISKIPSVFTEGSLQESYRLVEAENRIGADLISWMLRNLDVDDQTEALHLAHLVAAHGYFFPIDDHILTVKNDNTYYRFQTPCFWPSKSGDPENTEYAVYLCKRTMQNKQRLELADYEAENLARLQKMFSRKWEFIFMQAEAQAKVDKKRDKLERKVLDSQERAFWDVHRPAPGCVNTTEVDIKKACKVNRPLKTTKANYNVPGGRISPSVSEADLRSPVESMKSEVEKIRRRLERRRFKVSKCAESFVSYFEQYVEYDPFMSVPDPSNPWTCDNTEFWELDTTMKEIPLRRVKRWAFSIHELLKDPAGRDHFARFLEKEFSAENLKFWQASQELRYCPLNEVQNKVHEIYSEFLGPGACDPVNVDSRVMETVKRNVENSPDRWCFEEAEEHIFNLMKSDSYSRYLRSEMYKEFLGGTKKKSKKRFASEVRRLRELSSKSTTGANES